MRFSTITALCAAPLALAGSLQAELVARGALESEISARAQAAEIITSETTDTSRGTSRNNNNNNNNRNGQNSVVTTQVTEVIIIWVNQGGNAGTQTIGSTSSIPGAPAAQSTHLVVVGGAAGLQFTPDQINAAVGDMVIFEFHSNNHTATQSAFTTPCDPLAGGMDSGFMPNINNTVTPPPQMAMQVTVATPLWFYCRQANHCGKGMTFSINPTQNKTQAMFQQMAIAQKGNGAPAVIVGGTPAASPAPAASAAAPPAANAGTGMVSGTGTLNGAGACSCSCLCGTAAFPNAAVQGVGAFGGIPGAMPLSALEA